MLRLGLTGYPLGHSLSPQLHEAALDAMGLEGSYRLYPVPPDETGSQSLSGLCMALRRGDIHGLNVTIPHKRALLPYIDALTPTAQAVGAVNTLFLDGQRLCGDNTDAPGFLMDLAHQAGWIGGIPPEVMQPSAWVLGAGGSARAVTYSLVQAGWRVVVMARRLAQARELVEALALFVDPNCLSVQLLSRDTLSSLEAMPSLLVNTTPLGMHPQVESCPWPEGLRLPNNAFVYDLVYNPAMTVLVRKALNAGLRAHTGLGMLVEQAALSLERWTGSPVPREAMWKAVQSLLPTPVQDRHP